MENLSRQKFKLRQIIEDSISNISGLKELAGRFNRTERWSGCVPLMILDAAMTSTGLNYFHVVVPRLREFERAFVLSGKVVSLSDLAQFDQRFAIHIWRNERIWNVAKEIAGYLTSVSCCAKDALRKWAEESVPENWRSNPVGKIKGVGLVTFQYLRMMGGIDTAVPDRIVMGVLNSILERAGYEPVWDSLKFIRFVENLAKDFGTTATELCLMTWFMENQERVKDMP